jgi:hypothetical protein
MIIELEYEIAWALREINHWALIHLMMQIHVTLMDFIMVLMGILLAWMEI